jgi:hypothetical protein
VALLRWLLVFAALAPSAAAQARPAEPFYQLRYQPQLSPPHQCVSIFPARACSGARAPDHRYEGMAVGGVIGAGLGVLVGLWACEQAGDPDDSCAEAAVGGGLGGAALLGFLGMMIGAQFPKETRAPSDST